MPGSLETLPDDVWLAAAPKSPMPELGWAGEPYARCPAAACPPAPPHILLLLTLSFSSRSAPPHAFLLLTLSFSSRSPPPHALLLLTLCSSSRSAPRFANARSAARMHVAPRCVALHLARLHLQGFRVLQRRREAHGSPHHSDHPLASACGLSGVGGDCRKVSSSARRACQTAPILSHAPHYPTKLSSHPALHKQYPTLPRSSHPALHTAGTLRE